MIPLSGREPSVGYDRPVMPPFDIDPSDTSGPQANPPAGIEPSDGTESSPRRRGLSWQGRMVLIGGLVLTLLVIGGNALAHTLVHATGSGLCGGG